MGTMNWGSREYTLLKSRAHWLEFPAADCLRTLDFPGSLPMDLSAFKLDIDELIEEFVKEELRTLAGMKKIWIRRKFSYIFEARRPINLALFMQTLYSHSASHMMSNKSLSHKLGSLYCLYCLYETQPFKPPFKIYLSLGGLQELRALVVVAKEVGIRGVSAIVKRMLEKNMVLFGSVDINDYSEKERIKKLEDVQTDCMKKMHDELLTGTDIEPYLHMNLGVELDLETLNKISAEYAGSKSLAIKEASQVVDVGDIRHLAEERPTIGNEVAKINEEWDKQKELLRAVSHPEGESEQLMLLPSSEQNPGDDELHPASFMELLMGDESPQVDANVQAVDMDDDDLDYAKELENQLFDDW